MVHVGYENMVDSTSALVSAPKRKPATTPIDRESCSMFKITPGVVLSMFSLPLSSVAGGVVVHWL